ncbi:helix-turn-helix domain-containing protein [Alteribacillus sp. HJP-4]|uniref:helix-turn-helix domain-containing protein n=1 Tax=Alteribacillus sp. HJP-4 TaxID=2775394 RepID=UPI0035CCE018
MIRLRRKPQQKTGPDWKSNYFRKSFILILLITSIPGIIFGIGFYGFGVVKVEEGLREIHENQIDQRAENIDDQFNYLEISLSHWAFEPRFNDSLVNLDYVENFQETRDIVQTLLVLKGSHPLIDEVFLFVDAEEPVLFNPHYHRVTDQNDYSTYRSVLTDGEQVNWSIFNTSLSNGGEALTLTHNIPGVSRDPFGTILVTIDQQSFGQLLQTLTPYDQGATFMMNDEEELLVSRNNADDHGFVSAVKEEVLSHSEPDESFTMDWDGDTYSVSSGNLNRINSEWRYVSAAPISSITSPIVFISNLILIISLSVLIIAFLMTWFASSRIYRPVRKLMNVLAGDEKDEWMDEKRDEFEAIEDSWTKLSNESESLQKRLAAQIPLLKQSFLQQLTRGYLYDYSEEELRARMESYSWKLNKHEFFIMDIQSTGDFKSAVVSSNDESLVTFAMANIIEDIAGKYFNQYTMVNYHDLSIGMLIVTPDVSKIKNELYQCAQEITTRVNESLHLKVTVTLSETVKQVKRIPHLFEEVSQGKRFRNFENQNQIIDMQEMNKETDSYKVSYPFDIEKEIIQAVRRGRIAETEQLIRDFLHELTEVGKREITIHSGMLQLFGTIQHEILHSGIQPADLFQGRNMFDELTRIREPEQMVNWIVDEVISPYVEILQGRMDIEMKRLVEEVIEDIQQNFMEDISLDSCADSVGTTPHTLSKAFKKIIGINFIDYLTTIRMDKAKELLLQSTLKVNEISEAVGYRHSYFNRIFKKHVGVTPGQYRKMKSGA